MDNSILTLEKKINSFDNGQHQRFQSIFSLSTSQGTLCPPESMHDWINSFFGSIEAVKNQTIVKVTNTVTGEGSIFNSLRSQRPIESKENSDLTTKINNNIGDPFCHPLKKTPEDSFGRVIGKHCVTASNIAKYDGYHGIIVFNNHNPLEFTKEHVHDYIDTAMKWSQKVLSEDPLAYYSLFMWNCLWKSGGSIIHGHAQVTNTRDFHYAKIEDLRKRALNYEKETSNNYFENLISCYEDMGLLVQSEDVSIFPSITPIKEAETVLITKKFDSNFKDAIYTVLTTLRDQLDMKSFNLVIWMPPLVKKEGWDDFPILARVVNRGDPMASTSDVGAMELYASSVVATDPFVVYEKLKNAF